MKTNLNYCIVLSSEQLAYLAGSKYGIDRMKILHRLIEAAVLKETEYSIKGCLLYTSDAAVNSRV